MLGRCIKRRKKCRRCCDDRNVDANTVRMGVDLTRRQQPRRRFLDRYIQCHKKCQQFDRRPKCRRQDRHGGRRSNTPSTNTRRFFDRRSEQVVPSTNGVDAPDDGQNRLTFFMTATFGRRPKRGPNVVRICVDSKFYLTDVDVALYRRVL
jgi:hypothetical protein